MNKQQRTIHDFVSYYRELRPENFSDSRIYYETPLTRELFDIQLTNLSTNKKQSEFERFIIACIERIITPNIKPQTGPDGGGDGKVDAETYKVSKDIYDKWYVSNESAIGDEKWAFAISCKKQWKPKVYSDVEKIIQTNRGYSRILFFTNQYIKSSTRIDTERILSEKYNVYVEIFDASWCINTVFNHNCIDVALETLNFSDIYKNKKEIIGRNDAIRRKRLEETEVSILRHIEGLDTNYIEDLRNTYLLSRSLELSRTEIEGRFIRAMRECEKHGSKQQLFNIIYDHAWTSCFWFEDLEMMAADFSKLKEFVDAEPTVYRIEKLTNILSIMINTSNAGLFDHARLEIEIKYIKRLAECLKGREDKSSCYLFLSLFICEQNIITNLLLKNTIDKELDEIRPLLLNASKRFDISFDAQYEIIKNLNAVIDDNKKYEDLLDELTLIIKEKHSNQSAALIEMDRAISLFKKEKYKQAVRHFSFCITPFENNECVDELIKSSGMMGIALYNIGLPYSAIAYLTKSASLLLRSYYENGDIPHLLITVLQQLCEVELMLGRLVMYLNWRELLCVISNNIDIAKSKQLKEYLYIQDCLWAYRFVDANLNNNLFSKLPDVLEREGLFNSAMYLKYALGYQDILEEKVCSFFREDSWREKIFEENVSKCFFADSSISTGSRNELKTTVHNCTIHVCFNNNCQKQIIAEVILSSIEALLATIDDFEIIVINPDFYIEIIDTDDKPCFIKNESQNLYELMINETYNNSDLWGCISMFITFFFSNNAMMKVPLLNFIERKQNDERLMERVINLLQVKQSTYNVLGESFKNKIEHWYRDGDKEYPLKNLEIEYTVKNIKNNKQQYMSINTINKDISLWDKAEWKGCGFIFSYYNPQPPIFGLAFKHIEFGKTILQEWKEKIEKNKETISIYIIRGINREHPNWYRILITPNNITNLNDCRYTANMVRQHTMTPEDTSNIDAFEKQYNFFRGCWLCAFELDKNMQIVMPKKFNDAIRFEHIEFKDAWRIDCHDIASEGIMPDDNPFIPEEHKDNAPVLEVMKQLSKMLKS